MRRLIAALALAGVLVPLVAVAQTATAPAPTDRAPDRTVYRQKTIVNFNDTVIEGERQRPSGAYVIVKPPAQFEDRAPIRHDFVPELQRSVDQFH